MPSIPDFSEDEENDGPYSGGGGGASGGGAAVSGAASKQNEPEFVPWSRFVEANKDVSTREANDLNTAVSTRVADANKQRTDASSAFQSGIDSNYDVSAPTAGGPRRQPKAASQAFGTGTSASAFGAQPESTGVAAPPSFQQKAPAGMSAMQSGAPQTGPQSMQLGDKRQLKDSVVANGPQGPKSIAEQMGAEGWGRLVGDTSATEAAAKSLGSESGVEALLQQGGNTPNSAFDAALVNGQGRTAFGDTSKSGAGLSGQLTGALENSQNAWDGLAFEAGDARAQKAKRDFEAQATAEADAFNSRPQNAPGAAQAEAKAPGWTPEGYGDLAGFLHPGNDGVGGVYESAHTGSQMLSPADWITRGLGEAGVDVPMASEAFSGALAGDLAPEGHWDTANIRTGFQQVQNEYGPEAAQWLWDHLTPEMWESWSALGNPGSIAREMRKLMEQGGFTKRASDHDPSQIQAAGATKGEADAGTTDEQETARTNAYRDGWGTEWDRQFREGNDNPERA